MWGLDIVACKQRHTEKTDEAKSGFFLSFFLSFLVKR